MELACAPLRVARRWDGVSMAGRVAVLPAGQGSREGRGARDEGQRRAGAGVGVGARRPAGSQLAPGRREDLGPALSDVGSGLAAVAAALPRTLSHRRLGKGSNRSWEWEEGPLLLKEPSHTHGVGAGVASRAEDSPARAEWSPTLSLAPQSARGFAEARGLVPACSALPAASLPPLPQALGVKGRARG